MRPKRSIGVLLTAVLVAFGVTLIVPGVAFADNLGGIITADMNNDGIPDHVQLGDIGGLATWTVFSIDLNFDGIPDAGVIEKSGTGVTTVHYSRTTARATSRR